MPRTLAAFRGGGGEGNLWLLCVFIFQTARICRGCLHEIAGALVRREKENTCFFFLLELFGGWGNDLHADGGNGSGHFSPMRYNRKHSFRVFRFPFSTCHLVSNEIEGSRALKATASLACPSGSLPCQASLCLCDPAPPSRPVRSSSEDTISARLPRFPAAVGRMPHWLQILTLCRKPGWSWCDKWILPATGNTAPAHPLHPALAQAFPRLAEPGQGAGSRAAPRHHLLLPASMLGPGGYICREEPCA